MLPRRSSCIHENPASFYSVAVHAGLQHPGLVFAADTKKDAKTAPAGPIDLNNATQSQLESLNGVGPATAKENHRRPALRFGG